MEVRPTYITDKINQNAVKATDLTEEQVKAMRERDAVSAAERRELRRRQLDETLPSGKWLVAKCIEAGKANGKYGFFAVAKFDIGGQIVRTTATWPSEKVPLHQCQKFERLITALDYDDETDTYDTDKELLVLIGRDSKDNPTIEDFEPFEEAS